MPIILREYIGSNASVSKTAIKKPTSVKESFNDIGPISKESIIQTIEGIHVGPTRNYTWYMEEALDSSIPTWTKPYQRPLIMHHNETDGRTIGRILNVDKETKNTRSGTPALIFTCNVPDKEGKEQILDGRLKTVSIGVIAHDVRCSICGEQIEIINEYGETACGHDKGSFYDGKTCYWQIYKMEAKELSYVIVPSDIYAHNLKTVSASDYTKSFTEKTNSDVKINLTEGAENKMTKPKDITEGQALDEEVKGADPIAKTHEEAHEEVKEKAEKENTEVESKNNAEPEVKDEEKQKEDSKDEEDSKEKEILELKAKLSNVEKERDELSSKLEASAKELSEINKNLEGITKELTIETELKEAAEAELVKSKIAVREARESELNTLRSSLNKEILISESLKKRSDESLMDSIFDLKEEFNGIFNLKNIKETLNPTINSEKSEKSTHTNVKENKTIGNINVEEGLKDIFSDLFNPKSIY